MIEKKPLGFFPGNRRERTELIRRLKEEYLLITEDIRQKYKTGSGGWDLVLGLSGTIDAFIERLFHETEKVHLERKSSGLCLVALGGYGRKDLAPYSDIDILLLHPNKAASAAREINADFVRLLWDIGFQVGHSFCSVSQALKQGQADLSSRTALMESRFLAGNPRLFELFRGKFNRKMVSRNFFKTINKTEVFITGKIREREGIISKFGSIVNLSEPNIKESPGGLRDYHLALWVASAVMRCDTLESLAQKNLLSVKEHRDFKKSLDFIFRLRFALHFIHNRKNDSLSLEIQPRVAGELGFDGSDSLQRTRSLMKEYYRAANRISYLSRLVVSRCSGMMTRKGVKPVPLRDYPGLAETDKELVVENKSVLWKTFGAGPGKLLELFNLAAEKELDLNMELKSVIRDCLNLVDEGFRTDPANYETFKKILRQKKGYRFLQIMHEVDLLDLFIPEFGRLAGLVQRDPYHMFTVDEHVLILFRYLEELVVSNRKELADLKKTARKYSRCHILKLGCLLHDIGKGSVQGSHQETGEQTAGKILARWGIAGREAAGVLFLVRNHLRMSELSQHHDIHDPVIIGRFARLAGSLENLERLYLLTYADIRSVRENVWTIWKGALLAELFYRTKNRLLEEPSEEALKEEKSQLLNLLKKKFPARFVEEFGKVMPGRYFHSIDIEKVEEHLKLVVRLEQEKTPVSFRQNKRLGCTELLMANRDRKGNINCVSGVLAAFNLNIMGAQLFTSAAGVAVNTIQFCDRHGQAVSQEKDRISENLIKVMTGQVSLLELLEKRPRFLGRSKGKGVKVVTEVDFDQEMSPTHTVLRVSAQDKIGFLYLVTSVLLEEGLDIYLAKISTEGNRAVDTFYITGKQGGKITGERGQARLEARIKAVLADNL